MAHTTLPILLLLLWVEAGCEQDWPSFTSSGAQAPRIGLSPVVPRVSGRLLGCVQRAVDQGASRAHARGLSGEEQGRRTTCQARRFDRAFHVTAGPPVWSSCLAARQSGCGPGGRLLRLPVSFIHRCTESRLCAGNVIYRVEPGLVQRVEKDFGERAPLLLRQVQLAVNAALATGEGDPLATRVPGGLLSACLRSIQRRLHYRLQPWVDLPEELEHRLSRLADHYNRRTGQDLVITSGRRTAEAQAAAMYAKLERGVGLLRTYRKRRLAQELRRAFSSARRAGFSPRRIVASLVQAIQRQMQEGAFISAHLRGRAVDIRSRDMSRAHKRALRRAVSSMGGMRLIREERIPPHFHLDIRPEL